MSTKTTVLKLLLWLLCMIVKLAYLTNIPDSHHIVKKVCNWQENATIEHIFSHVYEMGRIEVKYSTNTTFSVHYFINRRNLQC